MGTSPTSDLALLSDKLSGFYGILQEMLGTQLWLA